MKKIINAFLFLAIFSIAMGYLESAVVVYLRKIYYPSGFDFPLVPMDSLLAFTELGRELATIVMLLTIAIIAGKNTLQRFAYFAYVFAVWDIFYYVFLKIILGWPESLLTWDLLFLIPVPWVGPVLAPVIVSFTLIIFAVIVLYFTEKPVVARIKRNELTIFVTGCIFIFIAFIWDYLATLYYQEFSLREAGIYSWPALLDRMNQYVPQHFNWPVFTAGEIILFAGIFIYFQRLSKSLHKQKELLLHY